ncbi:CRAL-TRIO domain-containing protein, partial [Flammula alnicola]
APEKPKPEQVPVAASTAEVASTSASNSETPELESPLTKKFTEAEWKALKEFGCVCTTPDIFADAFPDNAKARNTPINIWGVNVDPNSPQTDVRVSVILVKFLRARNLSVRDTRDMLIGTLRWRDYNIYGGNQDLKAVFGDVQRFIRWRVALMERNYEGVSLTSRDANSKAAAAEASNIFQSHYPELLYKKFFINVPTLLNWIFWAFKPLLSANTLAKMSVVGTGHHAIKKTLSEFIDVKELPKKYGGNADAF